MHLDMQWKGVSLDILLEHVDIDGKAKFVTTYSDGGYTTNLYSIKSLMVSGIMSQ